MSKDNFIFGTRAIIEAVRADKQIDKVLIKRDGDNELIKELISDLKKHKIRHFQRLYKKVFRH